MFVGYGEDMVKKNNLKLRVSGGGEDKYMWQNRPRGGTKNWDPGHMQMEQLEQEKTTVSSETG